MASHVTFAGSDRRHALLRTNVAANEAPKAVDNLLAARGILVGVMLGGGMWTLICITVWLIAR